MPASITVGQTGTLRFLASQAGLRDEDIQSVSWQPQGGQQAIKFHPPDQVEGVAVGVGKYKATVTLKTQGEKYTFPFDATCYAPAGSGLDLMAPVAIDVALIPPPTP